MKNKTRPRPVDETLFLNVDVDVYSKTSLQSLVAALGRKVIVHHVGREGRIQSAHFSLASTYRDDADTLAYRLARLVTRLPPAARQSWDRARRRDFNLGIQAGIAPYSHEIALTRRTLQRVVAVGGRVVITTYAPVAPSPTHTRSRRVQRAKRRPKR
jgi:hypothetical protein